MFRALQFMNDGVIRKATRALALSAVLSFCALQLSGALPLNAQARSGGTQTQAAPTQSAPAQSTEPWRLIQPPQSSLVFAMDGSLIGEIGKEWRTSVPISTLPKFLPNAFIAIEDQRFRKHDGVDLVGVVGAIKDNILGDSRGASTITQQLVGNMHPHLIDRSKRTLARKLEEQGAAREMEKHYTKDQILEAYLNQISFGRGWFGVEAAARHYFGKTAANLSLEEAATLAAMPKGPALYDPIKNPAAAKQRRNLVLSVMADQGYITRAEANAARAKPLITAPNAGVSAPSEYFNDAVRAEAEKAGINLSAGGYRVFTTLDPAMQTAATEALKAGALQLENQPGYAHLKFAARRAGQTNYLQGAIVAIDPFTGHVRALVGGRDYQLAPFNRATVAKRQPGSAFKPFVYAAAIADSIAAGSMQADTAISLTLPTNAVYSPGNSDGEFLGAITMREALVKSRNTVAVQLGLTVGMDSVVSLAKKLGVTSSIARVPSSAIGSSEVTPLELVSAYSAFANLGMAVEPRMVLRIEDARGRSVWAPRTAAPSLAIEPRVAFIVRDMLREAAERGTGAGARAQVPARIPIAGKTGTTNNNADVWFVGMTPDVVAGVWLGFDTPKTIAQGVFGGTLAAPIWGQMMARYYQGRQAGQFSVPGGLIALEIDRMTGMVADSLTPPQRKYKEYFIPGTEPAAVRPDPLRLFRLGPIGG